MIRILKLITFVSIAALVFSSFFTPQSNHSVVEVLHDPPFLNQGQKWVDSVMGKLTPEQRIGQLFMVAAYSNKPIAHQNEIAKLIKDQQIGGLIFMQGGPVRQAKLTNYYQKLSNVPLMISIDGEWGVSMRLDSTAVYPKQMTLGAIQNDTLIYQMGVRIAQECKRLGIHVNFAPVVDVNSNPSNPVINMRSFGSDKFNVAKKGIAYMLGMQNTGVLANAKHFPGHGDTDSDSHKTLPTINHTRERLDSIELYPFRELINFGLGSMMVAHLNVPALDKTAGRPTTLSPYVVDTLLRQELGFKGLVFTDALNMKGISANLTSNQINVNAIKAGNDILLFASDVASGISGIKAAIEKGEISQLEIDARCRKILHAKYWLGLDKFKPVQITNLVEDLNNENSELVRRKLTEASLTVLENNNVIPLKGLDTLKIAHLAVDGNRGSIFLKTLNKYTKVEGFIADKETLVDQKAQLLQKLKSFNLVIVTINNPKNTMSKKAGVNAAVSNFLAALNKQSTVIVNLMANPYSLSSLSDAATPAGLIVSYEDNDLSQELSAQLIFGSIKANGKLPVHIDDRYTFGSGKELSQVIRIKYTIPSEMGYTNKDFRKVDSLAEIAIKLKATPGCQVLIAQNGKVFYNKAFGHHTYSANSENVSITDLYDLASLTKVAATTLSIMRLTDELYIDIDKTVADYIPFLEKTNKGSMRIRDILAHQAGLPAWIPFYRATIKDASTKNKYYRNAESDSFRIKVADNLYIRNDYPDSILAVIAACNVDTKKNYKYSDLGYYFFKYIIENHSGKSLDKYVDSLFYKPIGLPRTSFNPLAHFSKDEIIPTEKDDLYRKQLIHGYVHDQGAAMMGGVGGHAGLFSNAGDLATIMQMILNKGVYGGQRFISEATINEFIRCQFCENDNRRGLGFDKPEMNYKKVGPTCQCVSSLSFGHTGFTGTIAWVDPEKNLIFVFLSNRVYPDAENKKLNILSTRTEIQEAIYQVL
ncbi:MAG: glycoside hydrolase family 3 N-terminal domain-containing protein [Bacteroidia bacterium]